MFIKPGIEVNQDPQNRQPVNSIAVINNQIVDHLEDEPTANEVTKAPTSKWAKEHLKEEEDKETLAALVDTYNTMMSNERHSSNQRGFEIR